MTAKLSEGQVRLIRAGQTITKAGKQKKEVKLTATKGEVSISK